LATFSVDTPHAMLHWYKLKRLAFTLYQSAMSLQTLPKKFLLLVHRNPKDYLAQYQRVLFPNI